MINISNIKKYLKKSLIGENSLAINYNFINYSGNFVKNEVFSDFAQFSGDNSSVNLEAIYNPGFFNKLEANIIQGSGKFNKNNLFRTSNPVNFKNFAFIIKYQNDLNHTQNKDGLGEILLQIKNFDNTLTPKCFVGLNDLRKVFLDFSGSGISSISLSNEIAKNNILALSYSEPNLDLYHINLFNKKITRNNLKIEDSNFNSKNKIFTFGNSDSINYTGFFGYINNILIFNKSLTIDDIYNLSLLIEKTGESLEQSFNYITGIYQESGYINPTGIIRTGVINYNIIQENILVQNNDNNINTYINLHSGITGYITGEKIEYKNVENVQKILTGESIIDLYDNYSLGLYSGEQSTIENIFQNNFSILFDNNFDRFTQ